MFLHLGFNKIILTKEIEFIGNLVEDDPSKTNKEFLDNYKSKHLVVKVGSIVPKSFILTNKKIMYLSPIDSETLIKRLRKGYFKAKVLRQKSRLR
ncbi:DUF370 domain-containing protein [bacterium]|nr:DUF370 domain-containing protein [bacterium]